jgi:hypothetical protein
VYPTSPVAGDDVVAQKLAKVGYPLHDTPLFLKIHFTHH